MDFPAPYAITPLHIHSFSRYTAAGQMGYVGGVVSASNLATRSWPAASLALYIPLMLPFEYTVSRVFICNGSTVTKNFDIGVYTTDGAKIFSSGATAQSGASSIQYVTLGSQVTLPPGSYYLAVTMDGTNGTAFATNLATVNQLRLAGCLQQASASTLPASATFAAIGNAFWPLFGLTRTTTGF